eukprot:SAG11_NODE_10186_length_849_cov_0.480000_2_plen_144_part_01
MKLHELFEKFDKDKSGDIDADELGLMFVTLGHVLPKQELQTMIAERDKNGDRKINFEEFRAMFDEHRGDTVGSTVTSSHHKVEMAAGEAARKYLMQSKSQLHAVAEVQQMGLALRQELHNALKENGVDLNSAFEALDVDGNGCV